MEEHEDWKRRNSERWREYMREYRRTHAGEINAKRRDKRKREIPAKPRHKLTDEERQQRAREANQRYYERHRNERLEKQRERKNSPRGAEYFRAYRATNRERLNEQAREWKARNPEKVLATSRRNEAKRCPWRPIMEAQLGRKLETMEIVHHIDADQSNNDLSNLVLVNEQEHMLAHRSLDALIKHLLAAEIVHFNRDTKLYELIT